MIAPADARAGTPAEAAACVFLCNRFLNNTRSRAQECLPCRARSECWRTLLNSELAPAIAPATPLVAVPPAGEWCVSSEGRPSTAAGSRDLCILCTRIDARRVMHARAAEPVPLQCSERSICQHLPPGTASASACAGACGTAGAGAGRRCRCRPLPPPPLPPPTSPPALAAMPAN
jgi:hypothetical protein